MPATFQDFRLMKIQDGPDILLWIYFLELLLMTSLLLIAVERSLAIVSPFRHRVLTKRVYGYCIARVWITYALITMITTMPELSEIRFWQVFLASFSPRLPSYI